VLSALATETLILKTVRLRSSTTGAQRGHRKGAQKRGESLKGQRAKGETIQESTKRPSADAAGHGGCGWRRCHPGDPGPVHGNGGEVRRQTVADRRNGRPGDINWTVGLCLGEGTLDTMVCCVERMETNRLRRISFDRVKKLAPDFTRKHLSFCQQKKYRIFPKGRSNEPQRVRGRWNRQKGVPTCSV